MTGGTGFLGAYLLRQLLAEDYGPIRAIYRSSSTFELVQPFKDQVEWMECDLGDILGLEAAMENVGRVYHCAGLVSFDPRDRKALFQVNVQGTANVVNASLAADVEKLLHVSSIAAIGRSRPGQTLNESISWEPSPYNSRYGQSKQLAEREVWRGQAEGLSTVIINPSIILGSGLWGHGPQRFFPLLAKGFPFYPMGNTGLVDVRDVVRMMTGLMNSLIENERFIANAETRDYRDFFNQIAVALEVPPPSRAVRPWMQSLVWRAAWIQSRLKGVRPFITRETARQSGLKFYFDPGKSQDRLSFEYRPIVETISETAIAFRKWEEDSQIRLLS